MEYISSKLEDLSIYYDPEYNKYFLSTWYELYNSKKDKYIKMVIPRIELPIDTSGKFSLLFNRNNNNKIEGVINIGFGETSVYPDKETGELYRIICEY